jgi:hypothetical protein
LARPRVFGCAGCAQQEALSAGTIFQRTRTPLPKWFPAACWMARDKRGVPALFLSRELGLRYEAAWLMAHELRHGVSEGADPRLEGLIEVDERRYGGRGKPESRGRGLSNANNTSEPMKQLSPSCSGLTRASIQTVARWMAGSRPAMTRNCW